MKSSPDGLTDLEIENFEQHESLHEEFFQNGIGTRKKSVAHIGFNGEDPSIKHVHVTTLNGLSFKKLEYIGYSSRVPSTEKDPIEHHFILLTQSVKLNSPYMD